MVNAGRPPPSLSKLDSSLVRANTRAVGFSAGVYEGWVDIEYLHSPADVPDSFPSEVRALGGAPGILFESLEYQENGTRNTPRLSSESTQLSTRTGSPGRTAIGMAFLRLRWWTTLKLLENVRLARISSPSHIVAVSLRGHCQDRQCAQRRRLC